MKVKLTYPEQNRVLKGYKVLKPLPNWRVGMVIDWSSQNRKEIIELYLSPKNNPDWFEPIYEEAKLPSLSQENLEFPCLAVSEVSGNTWLITHTGKDGKLGGIVITHEVKGFEGNGIGHFCSDHKAFYRLPANWRLEIEG